MKKTLEDLYMAVVTYNADPFIVENDEQAQEVLNDIEASSRCHEITDKEEFALASARLDFSEQVPPRKIYQFDGFIVCFAEDYGD